MRTVAEASTLTPAQRGTTYANTYLASWKPYRPFWNYEDGCVYKGALDLAAATQATSYFDFAYHAISERTAQDGTLTGFDPAELNIDNVNAGKALFTLYTQTNEARFRLAIESQHGQLEQHPRTKSRNFWHKKIYPNQVWLDGLYMAQPFRCAYAKLASRPEIVDDVLAQFRHVRATMRDERTGLYYHGWDETRAERWSNPRTGCSPCFWGRAMGWYAMALIDCIEFLPRGRDELSTELKGVSDALLRVQSARRLWYQVLDQGTRAGNYEEASATVMIAYALMKGARLGVLPSSYGDAGSRSYGAAVERFLMNDELTGICAVAGLGNVPYRDGSYEYYLSEPIVSNDPKGAGAFMMATAEAFRRDSAPPTH
jgi:unsaturated rhamnogalacturonyl hydrolase